MSMMEKTPQVARLYEDHSSVQYELGQDLIASHLRPFPGQTVLDLGCGTGRLARKIGSVVAKQGRVLGVDPNTERIAVATEEERRCSESHQRNLTFIPGLVHDAVQHGPFDAVFSNFALHWVPKDDTDASVSSIVKCLKPGGRLCANLTHDSGACANDLSLVTTGQTEESVTGMDFRSLQYWTDKFTAAGLQIEYALQDDNTTMNFPSVREYFDFVKAYTEGAVDYQKLNARELSDFMGNHSLGSLESKFVYILSVLTIVASKPEDR
ncbi:uncharacterized protein LOC135810539 [Sycon ciliatum]|uniref:uncharacterized protein LOC135810539 n=1 Tax=Sycon ciliatum TaxID=27933 RepID=UPI0031F71D95|eukprot:scpid81331/ scgid3182/ Uncharacterized methyltransferase C70.08c